MESEHADRAKSLADLAEQLPYADSHPVAAIAQVHATLALVSVMEQLIEMRGQEHDA